MYDAIFESAGRGASAYGWDSCSHWLEFTPNAETAVEFGSCVCLLGWPSPFRVTTTLARSCCTVTLKNGVACREESLFTESAPSIALLDKELASWGHAYDRYSAWQGDTHCLLFMLGDVYPLLFNSIHFRVSALYVYVPSCPSSCSRCF